jgi:glycosyltransferase involved in cell wall biosynthesis
MTAPDSPLLTVAIPAYNAMPFLPQAVDSILGQTYPRFKLLVIDDGSTDRTWEYLSSIHDPRVTILQQPNRGPGETSNRLLSLCDTPFYARMDADDRSLPERLAVQMDLLLGRTSLGVVGSQISYLVDEHITPALSFPTDHADIYEAFLANRHPMCNPTLLFRTALAKSIGGYRIAGYGDDVDFILRLCEITEATNTREILLYQRVHRDSGTFKASRACSLENRYALVCAKLRRHGLPEPDLQAFADGYYKGLAGRFNRSADWLSASAMTHYRRHLIHRARGALLRSAFHIAAAALCHPGGITSRVRRVMERVTPKRRALDRY